MIAHYMKHWWQVCDHGLRYVFVFVYLPICVRHIALVMEYTHAFAVKSDDMLLRFIHSFVIIFNGSQISKNLYIER